MFIKNKTALQAALKEEKKAIEARIKSIESVVERNKDRLFNYLEGNKYETSKASISFRKSVVVEVVDAGLIPKKYMTTTITVKPNKAGIKKMLKSGEVVEGAELKEKSNIQVK